MFAPDGRERPYAYRFPSCTNSGSRPEAKVQTVAGGMRKRPRARRVDTLAGHRPLALTTCSAEIGDRALHVLARADRAVATRRIGDRPEALHPHAAAVHALLG